MLSVARPVAQGGMAGPGCLDPPFLGRGETPAAPHYFPADFFSGGEMPRPSCLPQHWSEENGGRQGPKWRPPCLALPEGFCPFLSRLSPRYYLIFHVIPHSKCIY